MKNEKFDEELSELYQQRKSQLVVPDINLPETSYYKNYSILKLLSIFTVGGIASFGIMAVITHFAKDPNAHKLIVTHTQHQVKIANEPAKQVNDKLIVTIPKLPPKPELPELISEVGISPPVNNDALRSKVDTIDLNVVQIVKLPHLKEPDFLIKPVYKVMPKFSNKALQNQQSGAIRLRYEIDDMGSVTNIVVVNSDVNRVLQRSAKKALAKWKYKPDDNVRDNYEIIFEFNPSK